MDELKAPVFNLGSHVQNSAQIWRPPVLLAEIAREKKTM